MSDRAASSVRFILSLAVLTGVLTAAVVASVASAAPPPLPGVIRGTAGPDTLVGTPRPDILLGRSGNDILVGAGGADILNGGRGRDVLRGGAGPDSLNGGAGRDSIHGGPGNDHINGRGDAVADAVSCGPGKDTVLADARDLVAADCERIERALPLGTAPTTVTIEFLGWVSGNVNLASFPASVPSSAVPSGGTLTACAASDRFLFAFIRVNGLVRRTGVRAALDFPTGRDVVDLDSFTTRENGIIGFYRFFREPQRAGDPLPSLANGPYTLRLAIEASGRYTPVMEAGIQRSCA